MIGMLMGLGLGKTVAKLIAYVAVPLLVVGIIWFALDRYGDKRYAAGVADTDAKWEEASAKLKEAAAQSATKADDAAVKRLEEHVAQAEEDAAAVEKAKAEGRSPLDALFGG